ncbi:MAG: transglutaminase family protein [Pseudomonadota bacterium]
MSIKVALDHTTTYRYDKPVTLGPHIIRLKPAAHCRTPILSYSLNVTPAAHFINWQQDPFGNYLARLVFPEPCRELTVTVDLVARLDVINPFDFFVEDSAEQFPFDYDASTLDEVAPYRDVEPAGPRLHAWLKANRPDRRKVIDALVEINQAVQRDITYNVRMEPGVQSSEDTLRKASGSCRDSSWLLVEILRHYGIAARFVSGYLVQLTPDIKAIDGPVGAAADFTDLHAWVEAYLPGAGWVGLDPTSGLFAGEGHIPLACTPQPSSAAPISGAASAAADDFYFHNRVSRFDERPRVTKPYTDAVWADVLALGERVDRQLSEDDVRLSMGGEPTFVSTENLESPEWNEAALGEHKTERAAALMARLRTAFAPAGVTAFAQGKWYPGEPTPRWAMICHWRRDGEPIWRDPTRLARPGQGGATPADAEQVVKGLCTQLGLDAGCARAVYEDPLHHVHLESLLPVETALRDLTLSDPDARAETVRQIDRGLDAPVGWILPLEHTGQRWVSQRWPLRRDEVFLIPGDSPAGMRLPLDSLPPDTAVDREARQVPEDPIYWGDALPGYNTLAQRHDAADEGGTTEAGGVIRTTLVAEVRDDTLYVFLPPVTSAAHWLDLMCALEHAVARTGTPCVIEGYEPPHDARLTSFRITPDPGVIEVNIHPSVSFDELVARTETLYDAAAHCKLAAEKFNVDGRHTGTGGGNHVTLGGLTPADSPFLRRPDLLGSVIRYWQHHPSLSYLFSGLFVGPTSQAPRADEARSETLYELEMALARLPRGESDTPWLVDRLLRNMLVDLTGNTHRAEICIDKLYAPSGPTGRLGIVELRAFEMPPHARMSVVQALLIRCLISRFWNAPYTGELVRWGTELHDRFMLPHYLWRDLEDVVADLNTHGYAFDASWLDAFFEFRFPVYGERAIGDVQLQLRAAIEPWHVLGEEATASGMSRYVDSSVERLQLRVSGLTASRHIVTCNGYELPLVNTGTPGEYVVGVRYRAWQPPFCLHPDLPVDVPLVFDLIDTWNDRSLGGCAYHVSDPGGRNFEDKPVNANVAETRRLTRFDADMHTPAPAFQHARADAGSRFQSTEPSRAHRSRVIRQNTDYPCTADLRRVRSI